MKSMKAIVGTAVIAAGLTFGFTPAPAQAQSIVDIARVIVSINDIAYRGGVPYYRYGNYGPQDRIIVVRENGRNRYYRNVYRSQPSYGYGNNYGYYGNAPRGNAYGHYKNGKYQRARYYSGRDRWDRDDRRRWDRDDRRRWDRDDDNDQGKRRYRRGRDD